MPILSNPRHEKFAQALAEGQSATEAYETAGYTPNDGNAARMKGNDRVKERIAELQGQGAERAVVTLERLIAEAGDIQAKALAKEHYAAAVSALTVKAKLSGHWVDRGENKTSNVIYTISDEPLTEEEWAAKYGAEVVS
jgi:phage terminase small subunit